MRLWVAVIFCMLWSGIEGDEWRASLGDTAVVWSMPEEVLFADPIKLSLRIEGNNEIDWLALEQQLLRFSDGKLRFIEFEERRGEQDGVEGIFTLEALGIGNIVVGPLVLELQEGDLVIPATAFSIEEAPKHPIPALRVLSLHQVHDIALADHVRQNLELDEKQLSQAEHNSRAFENARLPWRLVLLLACLSLGAVYYRRIVRLLQGWMQKKKLRMEKSHREKALYLLSRLKERYISQGLPIEQLYVDVTTICREFIEGEYGIHAPEQTTEEFLQEALDASCFSPEQIQLLQEFLVEADLVKFACFQPEHSAISKVIASAQRLIITE